jgi:hypothetical protein
VFVVVIVVIVVESTPGWPGRWRSSTAAAAAATTTSHAILLIPQRQLTLTKHQLLLAKGERRHVGISSSVSLGDILIVH